MVYTLIAHPVLQVSEVAPHESESLIIELVLFSIFILVETVQMTVLSKSAEYLSAVAATTKGNVYIYAIRFNVKTIDAFLK